MLKQVLKENLETVLMYSLLQFGADETLAYDIAKQCVTEEDVEGCLETMFEHISEREFELIQQFFSSELHQRYTQAVTEGMRIIDNRVKETLYLLKESKGMA